MNNNNNNTKRFSSSYEVEVQSNCSGILIYKSKSTGFEVVWENLGDINYMTIGDLKEMAATQRGFFKNNWIIINNDEADKIYHFLRVDDCYKSNLRIDKFIDNLTLDKINQFEKDLKNASESLRRSIADAVLIEYNEGRLDSLSLIKRLEKILNFSIISNENEDD